MVYSISKQDKIVKGEISLAGSKSISNRVLIIRALGRKDFQINEIANSRDTQTLQTLLCGGREILDCGPAGTTFRFLTAYLALQQGTQILTGSERMKQRPIGVLVEALETLGARIEYLEKEGFPPLKIAAPNFLRKTNRLTISAGTSSQFISALLMIAPVLPKGLELMLEGKIVSRPYIEMTLHLMKNFGINYSWFGNRIKIPPQKYLGKDFVVEADWSAASYYYAMAVFSTKLKLQLNGLFKNSIQGDACLPMAMENFGIQTIFNKKGIRLTKNGEEPIPFFECDFLHCPDIAQTLAVVCAGLGTQALFSGLGTLRVKETDRIAALQNELAKVQVFLSKLPGRFSKKSAKEYYSIEGIANVEGTPLFSTYEDHRMAMAFAPFALFAPIKMQDPQVVEKSYPDFWTDIEQLGFAVSNDA